MRVGNNFSNSASFNIFYLVEPNKSVTHTHTHTFQRSKPLYKGDSGAPGAGLVRRFKHLQGAFKALCRCFFVCVGQRMKQENV